MPSRLTADDSALNSGVQGVCDFDNWPLPMIKPVVLSALAMLIIAPAQANLTLYQQLSAPDLPSPMQILQKVERQYQHYGQIIEFEIELEDGQIFYEVELVKQRQLTELLLDRQGQLLQQEFDIADIDNDPELHALALLNQQPNRFSYYVQQTISQHQGYLLEAELEYNIGISYLEVELLSEQGKRKLALDLKTGQPLPILNWF